MKKPLESIVWI